MFDSYEPEPPRSSERTRDFCVHKTAMAELLAGKLADAQVTHLERCTYKLSPCQLGSRTT